MILHSPRSPFLQEILPFLHGFTLFFWATGTWWIPMLVILGMWRHVYKRYKLVYDPLYWGAVFPLGMYTVCTLARLGDNIHWVSAYACDRFRWFTDSARSPPVVCCWVR